MNWQNQKCTCGDILHPLPVKTFSYYEVKRGTPIADVHVCKLKYVPYYAYNHAYGYVVIDTLNHVTIRTYM